MKAIRIVSALLFLASVSPLIGESFSSPPSQDVLRVKGRYLYDEADNQIILRGMDDFQGRHEAAIARTGANILRLAYPLSPGELDRVLYKAIAEEGLIVSLMLPVGPLVGNVALAWGRPEYRDVIRNYESRLILHAFGEAPYNGFTKELNERWTREALAAIRTMRGYGYRAPLEILSNSYGQNLRILLAKGKELIESDPEKNILLGYQCYSKTQINDGNRMTIEQAIRAAADSALPIIVGVCPFTGPDGKPRWGFPADGWSRAWKETWRRKLHATYWCWSGSPSWFPARDNLSVDGSYGNWTKYGEAICGDGEYSLARTAVKNYTPMANRPPRVVKLIVDHYFGPEDPGVFTHARLTECFNDYEDGERLDFRVVAQSRPDLVSIRIDSTGNLNLETMPGRTGFSQIRIEASDSGGKTAGARFTVAVIDPAEKNFAERAGVTVSSTEKGTQARSVNDGFRGSRWASEWSDPQWLIIDLGAIKPVRRLCLHWEAAYGLDYELQVSIDGRDWHTVVHEGASDGDIDDFPIDPVQARYVRFVGTKRATPWGYSLLEFEVYGTP